VASSANAATNVIADISTEPVNLQEVDDEFVDIDDILFDEALEELDLSGVQRFRQARAPSSTAIATATATATTTAAVMAAVTTTATAAAPATVPATARKRGRPKGAKDKEPRKRRPKATGGGDTAATSN
jgi:hypothetical protein